MTDTTMNTNATTAMTATTGTTAPPVKPGTRKVTVGALSGALVTVVLYLLGENGMTVSGEVTGAMSTIVTTFLVYMTTETFT
tara:strand:+ start:6064 stop:6309 length:246 start_codon:yes stop_codon:yes gene_type:complete